MNTAHFLSETAQAERISSHSFNTTGLNRGSRQRTESIRHYLLKDSLPEGDVLALNVTLGTLSHLTMRDNIPTLISQQQFTSNELTMLLPLLDNHPYFCPFEVMYANFYNGAVDEQTIALSRNQLESAEDMGIWDQQMRPIRNVISRTRLKMQRMGIDILVILRAGYVLRYTGVKEHHARKE